MDIFVWVVVLPHELAPEVCGVFFELAEAEDLAIGLDADAVVDRVLLTT
ncbi:hypothetical protein [Leifsonia naganoensis]|uniref:Uncharacterized protein n=1 Tax=Leifsonia naganoensis TaxID=150025 RepID=A0A853DR63_9MICO|nr:hypothetical protein [Leifsonia naganoensis]NYK10113.1 hypothetical protein [Leifsonia naganoensis]